MATGALTAEATRRPRVFAASITFLMALIMVGSIVAISLLGQPAAPTARYTDRYANLAGMGGLPHPAPRLTADHWADFKDRFGNLAGTGGLPHPAPRD